MNGYLRQSTASQSRLIGPFVDDTDFKTTETGLTIANTDIKLRANGTTLSNKNSGGGTHQVNGMYSLTWDATDTANVGELFFSVVVAGALPVFGTYVVLEEAVYDALFAASAPGYVADQPVNATKLGGTTQTGRDIGASVLLSPGTGTGQLDLSSGKVLLQATQTGVTIPTVTTITNDVGITQTGADKVWSSATRTLTAFSTALAVSVWDVLTANIGTASSIGLKLKNWVLGSDNKALLSSDAQTGVTIPTVTTLTNAPGDSSGVTTLLSRLSALRAGYLDNLSAGAVALETSLQGLITTIGASAAGVAAAVWSAATRVLTAGTNIVLAKGTGVTGFNDLSAADVNAEADAALADYDGPTNSQLATALADSDDAVLAAIAALDNSLIIRRGTIQDAFLNTVTLDVGASTENGYYANNVIVITAGTGAGQTRRITNYSGFSQVATLDSAWTAAPDSASEYAILADGATGSIYGNIYGDLMGNVSTVAAQTITAEVWEDDNSTRTTADSAGNKLRQGLILYEGN